MKDELYINNKYQGSCFFLSRPLLVVDIRDPRMSSTSRTLLAVISGRLPRLGFGFFSNSRLYTYIMTLNEANTRKQLIDRALESVGWKDEYLNCEHTFTVGKKTPGGGKGKQCSVDYLLQYNNINVGLIEAKKESLQITEGLQQAQDYGTKLGVRFVYSTNGQGIFEYDMHSENG